ncbi:MAG: heavy-metal-associated domain-containing protein [Desulfurivibrio sp.]|nr:heavy-metal-associated domain-containing protein [Desulfurivibrio sp.]MBU3936079.1 cation transporter [Pseudomonadota bacterium]MBU4118943.1 cation transporter [Pseudomonadota bacterium]
MPTIHIKGMSCGHCVASVTSALNAVDGLSEVNVSLEKKEATFNQSKDIPLTAIKKAIDAIGFEVVD